MKNGKNWIFFNIFENLMNIGPRAHAVYTKKYKVVLFLNNTRIKLKLEARNVFDRLNKKHVKKLEFWAFMKTWCPFYIVSRQYLPKYSL